MPQYLAALNRSFAAAYALLGQPKAARRAVACLLVLQTTLLAYSASVHTPSLNEPGHLVAGLSHWKFANFKLYCINPPLVRMVAALPILAIELKEDWSGNLDGPGITGMGIFGMGENFVAANGERSNFLFMIARWACIPFSWVGAIVCYLWARDLYGRQAGVLACLLWCFEPNILAHSSMITPDAHATALGLAACYSFWLWLRVPTWKRTAVTGVILGLAELAKTTLVLLYVLWPVVWLIYRWSDRNAMHLSQWLREAAMLLMRMAIAIYVINLGYGFERTLRPLKEFQFSSELFTASELLPAGKSDDGGNAAAQQPRSSVGVNRFANTILGELPVPFPESYVLGIDLQRDTFESYPRPSYLGGTWRMGGWWYYYLYAMAIKVPLGLLALFLLGRGKSYFNGRATSVAERNASIDNIVRYSSTQLRDTFVLLVPAAVIFVAVSAETGFSEHMRYVLPAFPFCLIALSGVLSHDLTRFPLAASRTVTTPGDPSSPATHGAIHLALITVCVSWLVGSSLYVFPHSLSYFNESIGGPLNGHRYLHSSNIDWGQDLSYLVKWERRRESSVPLKLAYYGFVPPGALGLADAAPFEPSRDLRPPGDESGTAMTPGYYAISVNLLIGLPWAARDGTSQTNTLSPGTVDSVISARLVARAGYSIWIYRIDAPLVGARAAMRRSPSF